MKLKKLLKIIAQISLILAFTYFIAMPAFVESPSVAYAEGKSALQKRADARKRSALRLINRAMQETDEAKKQQMIDEITTQCNLDGYSCTGKNGAALAQVTAARCNECVLAECIECCDAMATRRTEKCKNEC